jgi:hypothetical protein
MLLVVVRPGQEGRAFKGNYADGYHNEISRHIYIGLESLSDPA